MAVQATAISDPISEYGSRRLLFHHMTMEDATGQDGLLNLSRTFELHPVSRRQLAGTPFAVNGPLKASPDLDPMEMTHDRLGPARGLIFGLGLGASMWAVIGMLVLWSA